MLTGDKLETAVNIAHSCGHFKRGMLIFEISGAGGIEDMLIQSRYLPVVVLKVSEIMNFFFTGKV